MVPIDEAAGDEIEHRRLCALTHAYSRLFTLPREEMSSNEVRDAPIWQGLQRREDTSSIARRVG